MGAKSAVKLRKRLAAFKCNVCGRKLVNSEALETHLLTAHNINNKRRGRAKPEKLGKALLPTKKQKTVAKVPTNAQCKTIKSTVQNKGETNPVPISNTQKMSGKAIEFQCPKCFIKFPTYFPARKHIQKYHCVDKQNVPVPPDHPNLINPVRIEQCQKCLRKVKSIEAHVCDKPVPPVKNAYEEKLYVCAGCEEWFPNLNMFDLHVASIHCENVESMFFPSSLEFVRWKTEMEYQTKSTYTLAEKHESSKRYYHCNYGNDFRTTDNTDYICPSALVIQEFQKGIQVHFYQQHHHNNHRATQYKLGQKYKKYSISAFLKNAENYESLLNLKPDDDDLYMQFKMLMEGIVVDAAKINIPTLKIILGKALEITSILSNYDEENLEDEMPITGLHEKDIMSDEQITKALEEPFEKIKSMEPISNVVKTVKRKNAEIGTITGDLPEKRLKLDEIVVKEEEEGLGKEKNDGTPKIIGAFSLADAVKGCKPIIISNENVSIKPRSRMSDKSKSNNTEDNSKINGEPSSFNDSYKDFVCKNFPSMESVSSRTRSKPPVAKTQTSAIAKPDDQKVVEKTKFSPKVVEQKPKSIPVSNKNVSPNTRLLRNTTEKIKPVPIKTVEEKPKTVVYSARSVDVKTRSVLYSTKVVDETTSTSVPVSNKTSPVSNKSSPVSNKVVDRKKVESNNREKTQTLEAQSVNRVTPYTSFDKPKVDIKYEVKEREDDCNILILKI